MSASHLSLRLLRRFVSTAGNIKMSVISSPASRNVILPLIDFPEYAGDWLLTLIAALRLRAATETDSHSAPGFELWPNTDFAGTDCLNPLWIPATSSLSASWEDWIRTLVQCEMLLFGIGNALSLLQGESDVTCADGELYIGFYRMWNLAKCLTIIIAFEVCSYDNRQPSLHIGP